MITARGERKSEGRVPCRRRPWAHAGRGFALLLGLAAAPAEAHAPPLAARVLGSPQGDREIVVTNRGLIFRELGSGTAQLLCNEALFVTTAEVPNVAVTGSGALLVATSSGLRRSEDQGCSWSEVADMGATNTPALAQHPTDPDTLFAGTYADTGGELRATRDGGSTWSSVLALGSGDFVRSLFVGSGDVVYATLTSFADGARPTHALLRSRDGGSRWERLELPLAEVDNAAMLAAAQPNDPETVILYTIANSPGLHPGRLLVSRDGGGSFATPFERAEIRGASFDRDGRLWVAARDGLYGAGAEYASFEALSSASELGCVLERDGSLLVCGRYAGQAASASGVGRLDEELGQFESWLDFGSVQSRVSCPPGSTTEALCRVPFRDWQAELLAGAFGGGASGSDGAGTGAPGPSPDIPLASGSEATSVLPADDPAAPSSEPACSSTTPGASASAAPARARAHRGERSLASALCATGVMVAGLALAALRRRRAS